VPDTLDEVLRQAQGLGFFGPAPVEEQRRHGGAFCELVLTDLEIGPESRWLDLGSGGGLPGLVLAHRLRDTGARGTLLDSQRRRARFLEQAVRRLGLPGVEVLAARAEDAARDPSHRGRYDLVVARSFGSPAVTVECATAFLRVSGRLAVSEPPGEEPARWDQATLAELGLGPPRRKAGGGATVVCLEKTGATAERWPRRAGVPAKRPLW